MTVVLRVLYGTQSGFLPNSLCWAADVFERLQSITTHERMERDYSVFVRELVANFQKQLEEIFQEIKFFRFTIKDRLCCCEGLGHFRYSVNVVVETGRNTVTCQLLKGQQNPVSFNCCRGVLTAKLWLTCGPRLLCLPEEVPRKQ